MPLPYNKKLTARAALLRKEATPQEKILWYRFLNKYPIRFKRQKPIDNFIVDFYCNSAGLVIELDGSQHFSEEGLLYDEERSRILENYGLFILRFTNTDVDKNFDGVCARVEETVKRRISEGPLSQFS